MLVNRLISQHTIKGFEIYPSAVRIVRDSYRVNQKPCEPPPRGTITAFSDASKRRLRFTAGNTSTPLISQFCLTYHKTCPDGRTTKKHLNAWLQRIRTLFPDVAYLWVLEFQTRGVPHYHIWLNLHHETPALRGILAKAWNRIAEPDSPEHLEFHKHKNNFVAWDMYATGYLVKYLDKQHQKAVPVGYSDVGRFWGNSRGLLAIPEQITPADLEHLQPLDTETGELGTDPCTYIVRTLGKCHEKKLCRSPWRSRARTAMTSYTLQTAAPSFRQLRDYLQRCYENDTGNPF